jgi:hypothetical protein
MAKSPDLPPLVDNPLAPEFFADEATGFFIHQGNLSITFSSARPITDLALARSRAWLSAVWFCRLLRPPGWLWASKISCP